MPGGKIKITGGLLKSRIINFKKTLLLKPTKSFVRETIFNVISVDNNTKCLDLFSGSGILSAEAISRGAKNSTLVENNFQTCEKIIKEFINLNITNYKLINSDAINFLKNTANNYYDVIFLDAPYDSNITEECVNLLDNHNYFLNNTYLFLEQSKRNYNKNLINIVTKSHNLLKDLSIGDVSYTIARKRN